jgi:hypothetical protein
MRAQPLRMSGLHVTLCVMCTGGVPVGTDVLDPWNALADWAGRRRPDVRSRSRVRGVPRPQTRCSAKKHHTPEQIIVPPQRRAADIERAAQVNRDLLQAAIDRAHPVEAPGRLYVRRGDRAADGILRLMQRFATLSTPRQAAC